MNNGMNSEYRRPVTRYRGNGQMVRRDSYSGRSQGMGNRVPMNRPQVSSNMTNDCGCQNLAPITPDCECSQSQNSANAYSLGIAYVPVQKFQKLYPEAEGFQKGTIFSELNFPFLMTKCDRGGGRK